jgi:hypothetical protein
LSCLNALRRAGAQRHHDRNQKKPR